MRIISWNINGIRAVEKKGFLEWLYNESPDILCLQETKAEEKDLSGEIARPKGYFSYFAHSKKKRGYSGVCVYTKEEPYEVRDGIGIPTLDDEGRTLILYFSDFVLINAYFPNSGMDGRLSAKMEYNDAIFLYMEGLRKKGKEVILVGDLNVAHEEIDIARPKENEGHAGFRPEERAWMDEILSAGYVDTFRHFYPDKRGAYTYWDVFTRARDRNVGWRIDYCLVSQKLMKKVKSAFILDYVLGSDHCPVGVEINIQN